MGTTIELDLNNLTQEQVQQLVLTLGTEEGVEQLLEYLNRQDAERQKTITSSKPSFLGWLKSIGLNIIANRIYDMDWQSILNDIIIIINNILHI